MSVPSAPVGSLVASSASGSKWSAAHTEIYYWLDTAKLNLTAAAVRPAFNDKFGSLLVPLEGNRLLTRSYCFWVNKVKRQTIN